LFEDLNARMAELKEKGRNQEKWQHRLKSLQQELSGLQEERNRWQKKLAAEEEDVRKLSAMSLSNLLATVLGNKAEKLDREQREVLEAKVRYDAAESAVRDMERQISEIERRLLQLGSWQHEYERVFQAKERQILEENEELRELAEREAVLTVELKEVDEAVRAGQSALHDLNAAEEDLRSAKNWGTYDMLGGGMLSTHIKHGRIDEAMSHLHAARQSLQRFDRELKDIGASLSTNLNISGLLRFSDYFFDDFFSDWLVQGRINNSLDQVRNQTTAVSEVQRGLETAKRRLESERAEVHRKYVQAVEQYA
jgi:chromosome segregation ATPase